MTGNFSGDSPRSREEEEIEEFFFFFSQLKYSKLKEGT